jgi:hypothetical protein
MDASFFYGGFAVRVYATKRLRAAQRFRGSNGFAVARLHAASRL